ncbi:MAG: hypothetical protein ACFFCB_05780, partial [Candidatus Odinarchaeota archaeon]
TAAVLIPLGEASDGEIEVEYLENFTITVVMYDTIHDTNVSWASIESFWNGYPNVDFNLTEYVSGYSFYTFEFPANLSIGTWELTLRWLETPSAFGFTCPPIVIDVEITERQTVPITLVEAVAVYGTWNGTHIVESWSTTVPLDALEVPYGDFLYLYFNWTAADGSIVELGGGLATVGTLSVDIIYDTERMINGRTGYYLLILNSTRFGFGPKGIAVGVTKPNFEGQDSSTGFTVIYTPMSLTMYEIAGYSRLEGNAIELWVDFSLECIIYLEDTWHGWGVTDANITVPIEGFTSVEITPVTELGDGYYRIVVIRQGSETFLDFEINAMKTNYLLADSLHYSMQISFSPMFRATTNAAIFGAIILIIALVAWILWARVFSIPWEVRRMRKLAKTVEKDEGFTLSKKDYKKFHQKGIILEGKIDDAMSTIGVPATPAMIPAMEEVEEVTATEEDIIGELDKIPGLGAEEKAVLAEEMRKIPRKDRIWFLDDLKRQMGMRRMDFLTQRERPDKPTPPPEPVPEPEIEPEPKPKPKRKLKPKPKAPEKAKPTEEPSVPLEEVKPEEPPEPDRALTEDRTAPTVLPSDMKPIKVPTEVEIEIRRELDKIPGLDEDEKQALVDHLKYLSKEERQATYFSLKQSANDG